MTLGNLRYYISDLEYTIVCISLIVILSTLIICLLDTQNHNMRRLIVVVTRAAASMLFLIILALDTYKIVRLHIESGGVSFDWSNLYFVTNDLVILAVDCFFYSVIYLTNELRRL